MQKIGNGVKGIAWNTEHEVELLKRLNGEVTEEGATKGLARIDTDIDATEVILSLAPETNGEVAVKAWESLSKTTGLDHKHLAIPKEDEKIRFRDVVAQPRKIISAPTWSGLESEKVCYNAGYTNVHELIPWRTLSGRQQLYQDHLWMRAFGEALCVYRPPIDLKAVKPVIELQAERREADRSQLHHPTSKVGHPFDLYRQPFDAHAVAWRADRVGQRERRQEGRTSSIMTGSRPTTTTAHWSLAPWCRSA